MSLDFTLKKYEEFCRLLQKKRIPTLSVKKYLESICNNRFTLILRHDVDFKPKLAARMAEIEKKYNITSSYYFRMIKGIFVPSIIKYIERLGHEIGYHYEVVDKAKGDLGKAINIFTKELKEFRKFCDVKTISMHGNPLSKLDNRMIWKKYNFIDYGIIGEVYLSIDYNEVIYISDTCRTYSKNKPAITDFIPDQSITQNLNPDITTTNDLMQYLCDNKRDICILIHPNRWSSNWYEYIYQLTFDIIGNQVKRFIKSIK